MSPLVTRTLIALLSTTLTTASIVTAYTGYQGPGVYTLTNAGTGLRIDLYNGGNTANTPVYAWCSSNPYFNPHQTWQISALNATASQIINYGTGTLLSAALGSATGADVGVSGNAYLPADDVARWTLCPSSAGTGAVVIESVEYPGSVLDIGTSVGLSGLECGPGIQVVTVVVNPAVAGTANQEWNLQLQAGY